MIAVLRVLVGFALISSLVTILKSFQMVIETFDTLSFILLAAVVLFVCYYVGTFVV